MGETGRWIGKALLADDDRQVRAYVGEILAGLGYDVTSVESGNDALRHLQGDAFDILVTDIIMEHGEGIETILKARARNSEMPIVAMSGSARKELYLRLAGALGSDAVLKKPFTIAEFRAAVCAATATRVEARGK